MSNKKDKEKWLRKTENDKKRCINCSQLQKHYDGDYICHFLKTPDEKPNGGVIIRNPNIKNVSCFDKWNGKNVKKS